MVVKTGLVVPVKIGMSRKTVGSLIGRALKSCHLGVFTYWISADFFCLFLSFNQSPGVFEFYSQKSLAIFSFVFLQIMRATIAHSQTRRSAQ